VRATAVARLAAVGARDEAAPIVAAIVRDGGGPSVAARMRHRASAGREREDANFWWVIRKLEQRP
jgi:hypothetical protein